MSSDKLKLSDVLDAAAETALGIAEKKSGEVWKTIPDEGKRASLLATRRLTELGLRSIAGEDVLQLRRAVVSTLADWTWTASDIARVAIIDAVEEFLAIAGKALVVALVGLL